MPSPALLSVAGRQHRAVRGSASEDDQSSPHSDARSHISAFLLAHTTPLERMAAAREPGAPQSHRRPRPKPQHNDEVQARTLEVGSNPWTSGEDRA